MDVLILRSMIRSYFCFFVLAFSPCHGRLPLMKYMRTYLRTQTRCCENINSPSSSDLYFCVCVCGGGQRDRERERREPWRIPASSRMKNLLLFSEVGISRLVELAAPLHHCPMRRRGGGGHVLHTSALSLVISWTVDLYTLMNNF